MNKISTKRKEIFEVLSEYLMLSEGSNEETDFDKDKLDSFDKINLLIILEEYSDNEISIMDLFECKKIGDLCDLCF
ncbi:hypothetical protein AMQ84_00785 [Paenibacillus riograndensis]|uniref:Carrier domain-containing protein n=1 Tax=Paenibacillus riograndensis TaxID=483937 RepID=A0A132UCG7_9BACL|nr:phosphopantetheine-binding protein [Paenibacillus riograndensis]KWX81161.1 hypothetical protein AMQ84_00785 [Paenibacillus riograndensis]